MDTSSPMPPDQPRHRDTMLIAAVVIVVVGAVLARGIGHSSARTVAPGATPAGAAAAAPSSVLASPLETAAPSELASPPETPVPSNLASLPVTAPPSDAIFSVAPVGPFPVCRTADLKVAAGEGGAAAGNLSQPFAITNVAKAGCALQGYPTALEGWQAGAWHRLKFYEGTFFYLEQPTPAPVELAPGVAAELIIGTSDACNGGDIDDSKLYTRLRASLPGGAAIDLDAPVNAFCNLDVSSFHPAPAPQPPEPTPTPGPFDSLQFQMHAPATAVEGSTLSYDVAVTNPTDVDIALSPCPTWSEIIAVMSDPVPETISGPFDCSATPSVAAHSSILIPMVIKVPDAVGMAKFVWWFSGMPSGAVEILTVDALSPGRA